MDSSGLEVDVRPILEQLGGVLALDASVDLAAIEIGTESFVPTRAARLVSTLTNTGSGIVLEGSIDAEFSATCSRCLREFPLRLSAVVEGFFVEPGHDSDLPEEQDIGFVHEGSVDVMDPIVSALVLELPFAPLHAEDCPGICAQCGKDLADGSCGCEPDRSESPFAGLKDLLDESGPRS